MLFATRIALTSVFLSLSAAGQTTIAEDDFGGWSSAAWVESSADAFGAVDASGNPGDCYWVRLDGGGTMPFSGPYLTSLSAWSADQLWDLVVQGPILNIRFQFDFQGGSPMLSSSHPMVRQGGENYVALGQEVFVPGAWATIGPLDILFGEVEFVKQTGPHSFDMNAHPDFSSTGAPLGFGLYFWGLGQSNDSITYRFDNFRALINSPEITLSQTELTRDYVTVLTIADAQPTEVVYFYLSTNGIGPGPCLPYFGSTCLGILAPTYRLGFALTDATGTAHLLVLVPANAPLISVHTQAIIRRGPSGIDSVVSNTISDLVMP